MSSSSSIKKLALLNSSGGSGEGTTPFIPWHPHVSFHLLPAFAGRKLGSPPCFTYCNYSCHCFNSTLSCIYNHQLCAWNFYVTFKKFYFSHTQVFLLLSCSIWHKRIIYNYCDFQSISFLGFFPTIVDQRTKISYQNTKNEYVRYFIYKEYTPSFPGDKKVNLNISEVLLMLGFSLLFFDLFFSPNHSALSHSNIPICRVLVPETGSLQEHHL